jgi:hypothetical protein
MSLFLFFEETGSTVVDSPVGIDLQEDYFLNPDQLLLIRRLGVFCKGRGDGGVVANLYSVREEHVSTIPGLGLL